MTAEVAEARIAVQGRGFAAVLVAAALALAGCGATVTSEMQNNLQTVSKPEQRGAGLRSDGSPLDAAAQTQTAQLQTPQQQTSQIQTSQIQTGQIQTAQLQSAQLQSTSPQKSVQQSVQLPKPAAQLVSSATPGDTGYKIGPLDVIEVAVFKVPELSRVMQVSEGGTINMPLIGEVPAAGRTAQEVERDLAKKLGANYLQSPQVNIYVREFNSQRVTVEGAVKTSGVLQLRGRTTLMQVIALAGGINTEVAGSEVAVFRTTAGKRSVARFDIGEIRNGNAEDPLIVAGDLVVVDSSTLKAGFSSFLKLVPLASFAALAL